ncbi:MAG TPA: exopolysaccharide biosynthesis polyprenyl glycosylphosphotransferase [Terriglobia bacterium]|nr:exopolysaccharide biosynthesis polyprenyl glycosylphosphotransferase [Terriglobia bacterium]
MTTPMRIKIKLALLGGDLFLLALCLAAGTYIRLGNFSDLYERYSTAGALCLMIYPLCLYLTRSYEVQPEASSAENLRRPLLGWVFAATASSFFFYFAPDARFGRGIFAIANALFVFALLGWRLGIFLHLRRRSLTILLMGNPEEVEMARQLVREFSPLSHIHFWQPEAESGSTPDHFDPNGAPTGPNEFDLVVLAGRSLEPCTLRKAAALRLQGVLVWNLPRLFSEFAERLPARYLDERWVATAEGFRSLNERSFQVIKRLWDISLAFMGLLLTSPLLALAAVAIKLQDGGPVFYSQERVGKGGKTFRVHKLRTMVGQAEHITGPVWASPDDPRVTRVGRWLRKLRIDEVPQMWNVLQGEMSFVGPRPERPVFVAALQRKFAVYSLRHLVRPGITGWAQVRCPYAASEEDNLLKLEYDLYYLQNASMLFDIRIILKTISTVASGWGSW